MTKPVISFRHFGGSGPLSVYWHPGPFGDAVEAREGRGVAWLAPHGELLGVEFDDVAHDDDDQTLPRATEPRRGQCARQTGQGIGQVEVASPQADGRLTG